MLRPAGMNKRVHRYFKDVRGCFNQNYKGMECLECEFKEICDKWSFQVGMNPMTFKAIGRRVTTAPIPRQIA